MPIPGQIRKAYVGSAGLQLSCGMWYDEDSGFLDQAFFDYAFEEHALWFLCSEPWGRVWKQHAVMDPLW